MAQGEGSRVYLLHILLYIEASELMCLEIHLAIV